jgi:hypothetical protein
VGQEDNEGSQECTRAHCKVSRSDGHSSTKNVARLQWMRHIDGDSKAQRSHPLRRGSGHISDST